LPSAAFGGFKEKDLELMAKHFDKRSRADALLKTIEEAEQDYAAGRTRPLDVVLKKNYKKNDRA
jgi:hypothetical protein